MIFTSSKGSNNYVSRGRLFNIRMVQIDDVFHLYACRLDDSDHMSYCVVKSKEEVTVAVMSYCDAREEHDIDNFNPEVHLAYTYDSIANRSIN